MFLATAIESSNKHEKINKLKKYFESIDTDHSGEISSQEFHHAFKDQEEFEDGEIESIIELIDVNKNGQIDYTEFLAGCLDYKNYRQDEILRLMFNEIDFDGSKSIEKEELKKWLSKFNYSVSDDYLDEKFAIYTANNVNMT